MAESNNSNQRRGGGGDFPVRSLTMRTPHSHIAMDLTRDIDRFLSRTSTSPRYRDEAAVLDQAFEMVEIALKGLEVDRRKKRAPRDLYTLLANREKLPSQEAVLGEPEPSASKAASGSAAPANQTAPQDSTPARDSGSADDAPTTDESSGSSAPATSFQL